MKKVIGMLLVLVLMLSLAACSGESDDNVLVIGVDDAYPPMEYRDENNELIGFDVDFAAALSEELGMEIEWVPTAWDGIFAGLEAGKYDCIISSVSTTPDRLEAYDFSVPYLSNGQVIVVATGNDSINGSEDLEGKKVGVQISTTADTAAQKQDAITPFGDYKQYDEIIQTFADLETGRLDCIVVDYAVAIEYATSAPEKYTITTTQLTNEPIGVCMKKGSSELQEAINEAIKTLQDNGTMKAISEEWFGEDYVSDIDEELR